jgi:HEAT repeat protein
MRASYKMIAACVAGLAAHPLAAQQSIASRVAAIRDGTVRMTFESRAGACGDGRDMVAYRKAMFARDFEGWGTWGNTRCVAGPLRVALTMTGGQPSRVATRIGGEWPAAEGRVSDLGVVPAAEASAWFFSILPALETGSERSRMILPAVLADAPDVIPPLLSLARNEARTQTTRRQAILWLGLLGDAKVVPVLVSYARQAGESEKRSLASAALSALSNLEDGAGIPALLEMSREPNVTTRRESAFWLGQSGDPRGSARLHQMIEDEREDPKVRSHAIFSLSHGRPEAGDFRYLRDVYPRLGSDALKEAVFQGMQEDDADGSRWLIARARDTGESIRLRKSALFWAGQRAETRTADLLSVFRESNDQPIREHALFVLSQRQDQAATDALIGIARGDGDTRMRGKALFWLAQKHDPQVTKLITDLVTSP